MHLLKTFTVLAFPSIAYAQSKTLYFTNPPSVAQDGQSVTIKYVAPDMSKPVIISLRQGSKKNLVMIATLTETATGGSYTWTPSGSLESGTQFALEIVQGNQTNYSPEFTINGSSSSTTTSVSAHPQSSKTSAMGSSSASSMSTVPSITLYSSNFANQTTPMTSLPTVSSGLTTIPLSRNGTFVAPTPSMTVSTASSSGGGGTGAPVPSVNAASALRGPMVVFLAVAVAAVANSY